MRLPLTLLALLGAGCASPDGGVAPESAAYGDPPAAEPVAAEPPSPSPPAAVAARSPEPEPEPERLGTEPSQPPPTGPIDQLFRAPADPNAPPPVVEPVRPAPVLVPEPVVSKPAPPPAPPPPPPPRPRPWGDDPCPPCGMG